MLPSHRADQRIVERVAKVDTQDLAALAACGYAKYTGKLGVCLATSGPGGLHPADDVRRGEVVTRAHEEDDRADGGHRPYKAVHQSRHQGGAGDPWPHDAHTSSSATRSGTPTRSDPLTVIAPVADGCERALAAPHLRLLTRSDRMGTRVHNVQIDLPADHYDEVVAFWAAALLAAVVLGLYLLLDSTFARTRVSASLACL